MREITLRELLEAGCHFGHQARRWHPKAEPYIFTKRDGVHIIDLVKTKEKLEEAGRLLQTLGAEEKPVVFVGTKRQAKAIVASEAKRAGALYLTERWIGGLLTNWDQVKKNLEKMRKMKQDKEADGWAVYPKHEQMKLNKELIKLENLYGGIAGLNNLPRALVIIDVKNESSALKEARRTNVAVAAVVDTNTDPTEVDYPIPANDDATGSIEFLVKYLADAYAEGRMAGEKEKILVEVKDETPSELKDKAKTLNKNQKPRTKRQISNKH